MKGGEELSDQESESEKLWQKADERLREILNEDTYDRWIAGIVPICISGKHFKLGVSNELFCEWLNHNYSSMIEETLYELTGETYKACFESGYKPQAQHSAKRKKTNDAGKTARSETAKAGGNAAKRTSKSNQKSTGKDQNSGTQIKYNKRFTFDNFVVGDNSKFAHAACSAVARNPGTSYNPLFIHAGTGLGKTHLLQAIAQDVQKRQQDTVIEYLSSEDFANGYIDALRERRLPGFRQHYRNVDLLLIDDVHFFTGKEQLQEEFFHTFNALFNQHKQIVLSSDRPPQDIGGLEKRLVSRFEWGLATQIEQPEFETRVAILQEKQQDHAVTIDHEVLNFVASRIKSNVRRLEGALIRLVSYRSMTGKEVDLDTAETLLRPLMDKESAGLLTVEQVQRAVAEFYDVRVADMTSKKRPASIALPRQIAMYLCRRNTEYSTPAIGECFNRNHATILHAVNAVEKRLAEDDECRQAIDLLERKLKR